MYADNVPLYNGEKIMIEKKVFWYDKYFVRVLDKFDLIWQLDFFQTIYYTILTTVLPSFKTQLSNLKSGQNVTNKQSSWFFHQDLV